MDHKLITPDLPRSEISAAGEYANLREQWRRGINVAEADEAEINEFTYYKIREYEQDDIYDEELHISFSHSFQYFTDEILKTVDVTTLL
ncbi:hypothetical protein DID88_007359 [Monilinia fructigena]|uniref:Uncharacterized protein n=1 Tax=Monilinia fructigena TaxID=38457 RepID=A0A395JD27_9HELO|nr:hypothetical protein DID88_007359 [Monilinia fructigena]